MTYKIFEGNIEKLRKKMTAIQNKCAKYGCEFHYAEIGEEYKELTDENGDKYTARFVVVEAEGKAVVNGWQFVASLDWTEKGNIINKAVEIEVPERYYNQAPTCEHCNTKHFRKYTYIVRNVETGEFKQVGTSCLKDFTHGMSAEGVAKYTAAFDELIQAEAPGYGSGWFGKYYLTETYLLFVAETIRHFGYERSDALGGGTRDRAYDYMQARFDAIHNKARQTELRAEMERVGFNHESQEAKKMVAEALAWLDGQEESNNYMHNLKVACGCQYISGAYGIAASLFPTYNRELEYQAKKKAEAEAAKGSEHVGKIGQRIEIEVADWKAVTGWETDWGYVTIYKIEDKTGNVFTWKTTGYIPEFTVTIKGTIKEHNEFRGVKQTELTRCKCIEKAPEQKYEGSAQEAFDLSYAAF